jgi:hypothetical protein
MNSNKKSIPKKNSLNNYGKFISVYRGSGTVSIIDGAGEKPEKCSFEVGQRIDGNIILLCHDLPQLLPFFFRFGMLATKFEGKTEEGYSVRSNEAEKGLIRIGYLPKSKSGLYDQNLALEITELSIVYSEGEYQKLHFGISNFQFDKNDTLDNGKEKKVIIPLTRGENIEISFKKLNGYENKINRISTLRALDVTCEFVLKISNQNDINKLIELVDDICYLLSVKNGTKISWVYYNVRDKNGKTIVRKHVSKVTKAYQSLNIFYCCEKSSVQTIKFLEDSYPYFMKYRDLLRLKRGVIDAYLDAKAEADYIETRGGKIALAIEFLKNEYLASKGENSEYIFPPQEFKKSISSISDAMVNALKLRGLSDQSKIRLISGEKKIEGLNRRSFGSILRALIKEFHVSVTPDEITLFIKCRDSLVHRGNFYCKTSRSDDIRECEPLPSYMFEYFFMVNVLDRIFLRIIGQDDSLIRVDWRNPSEKMKDALL